jgi:RecB family exonuclease
MKVFEIQALKRISPSQYYSALNCPYKIVLASSLAYESLLPMNANAYFGSVIHKMLELISKRIVFDETSFTEHWTHLISNKEDELRKMGLSGIIPLKYSVDAFALKKNQLKGILRRRLDRFIPDKRPTKIYYQPEKRLENSDKTIGGIADLIIENDSEISILDFKTGKIYNDAIDESGNVERVIKAEYEFQLKLYAHLYFLMKGIYPTALFLVTLINDFVELPFEKQDCERIYLEALDFLSRTNQFIQEEAFESIAKPSELNCKYCAYRPACKFYTEWLRSNSEVTNDLSGLLQNVAAFNNETMGLQLTVNNAQVLVNGFTSGLKKDFDRLVGKNITIYNIRKIKHSLNASATNYTVTYE